MYYNAYGDGSSTRVGAYQCKKCGGIYEWYMPYGSPTVRTELFGEAKGTHAPAHAKTTILIAKKK